MKYKYEKCSWGERGGRITCRRKTSGNSETVLSQGQYMAYKWNLCWMRHGTLRIGVSSEVINVAEYESLVMLKKLLPYIDW